MFYTIYQITNKINGKIYIGSHKTGDLNDEYMGSGLMLNRAFQKYGIENFDKQTLFIFDTADEMYKKENELVNEDFIQRKDTYNLKIGGNGGWDYINNSGKNLYGKNGQIGYGGENLNIARTNFVERLKTDIDFKNQFRQKISKGMKKFYKENPNPFAGRTHTEETKRKIGKANSINQQGSRNSQYGKCWVSDLETQKSFSVKKEQLETYLTSGFVRGRNAWNKLRKEKTKRTKIDQNKKDRHQEKIDNAYYWYNKLLHSNAKSIRKFVRDSDYDKSHVSFIKMLKTYVSEFETTHGKSYR